MKRCICCKKILDKDLFNPSKRSKDGLMAKCQLCAEKAKQSYHQNSARSKRNYCLICAEQGIYKPAVFGLSSDKIRVRCDNHKTPKMVKLASLCIICQKQYVSKHASFGFMTDSIRTHCVSHKTVGMINLVHLKGGCVVCQQQGSFKRASFGLENGIKSHCGEHKSDKMIDLVNLKQICITCKKQGIYKHACFGLIDGVKTHCVLHKTNEMIDLENIKKGCVTCKQQGIFKRASFGKSNDSIKSHCVLHKTNDMIDLAHLKGGCITCQEQGIYKRASFGLLINNIKTRCSAHKTSDMINLADLKKICSICKQDDIIRQASYGYIDDQIKIYCSAHKVEGMVDLVNLKKRCLMCKQNGIYKLASYGFLTDTVRSSCSAHKTAGMIDLQNLKQGCRICKIHGIFKQATFGPLFEKKIHCTVHARPNEYSKNNPKCEKCFEKPFYGDEKLDELPKRCEKHKKQDDIDMISRKCELCGDEYFIPSTQTKCRGCLGWLVQKTHNRGLKERQVADCLTRLSKFIGSPKPINDRQITNGCSQRRPDFYYPEFMDTFSLIVEVDEYQHSRYSCGIQGELTRMITLYEEDSGGFPLLFIRFNPDPYYYRGKKVTPYRGREEKLADVIKGLKNTINLEYTIGVIYLFYDNFDEVEIEPLRYKTRDGYMKIYHKHPLSAKQEHSYKL